MVVCCWWPGAYLRQANLQLPSGRCLVGTCQVCPNVMHSPWRPLQFTAHALVNPLRPGDTHMRLWTRPSLVQVMAWRLFGDKPLPEATLSYRNHRNKFQRHSNQSWECFIKKNAFENVVCKMSSIPYLVYCFNTPDSMTPKLVPTDLASVFNNSNKPYPRPSNIWSDGIHVPPIPYVYMAYHKEPCITTQLDGALSHTFYGWS